MLSPKNVQKADLLILGAIGLSFCLTVLGCALFIREVNLLINLTQEVKEKGRTVNILRNTLDALQDQEAGQRGYLLTGKAIYLIPYYRGRDRLRKELPELDQLLGNLVLGEPYLAKYLIELSKVKEEELLKTLALYDSGNVGLAIELAMSDEGKFYMDQIRSLVSQYVDKYSEQIRHANDQADMQLYKSKRIFIFWILAISCLIALAFWNARNSQRLLKEASDQMTVLAMHDPLTGLPNRRYLNDWLPMVMAKGERYRHPVAVLYIDLDGFGIINNRLGHEAGDIALKRASKAFNEKLRDSDFLARLGGDEFVIVTSNLDRGSLSRFAQRLIDVLENLVPADSVPKGTMSASIGIAIASQDANTPEGLLSKADQAMYKAKKDGKRGYRFAS